MNNKAKLLLPLIPFISLVVISCGNRPFSQSEMDTSQSNPMSISETTSPFSSKESSSISSEDSEQSIIPSSSSEDQNNYHFEPFCKDELHNFIKCVPVEGGHQKHCDECGTFIGEKENHVYFSENYLYCPICGGYDETVAPYELSNDFNVIVKTGNGNVSRKILAKIYQTANGEFFALSSPSNAHSSYSDSNVEGVRFFYDNNIDDGTKLFVLKETATRETLETCKEIYTYTLAVYNSIVSGSFSYKSGHISIGEQAISTWLEAHTPLNQITYKNLRIQHSNDNYVVPVPGTCATIIDVTCEDCGQFLYQQTSYSHQFSDTQWLYEGKNDFNKDILIFFNSNGYESILVYGETSCSKCNKAFIDVPLNHFSQDHVSNDGAIDVYRYEFDRSNDTLRLCGDYSVSYTHFAHILKDGECVFCHAKP